MGHRARIVEGKIESRIRKALRLSTRTIHGQANLAGEVNLAGRVTAIKGTSATTLDDQVEWLLRRDQEAQRDVSELAVRVSRLEGDVTQLLQALRDELKGEIASKVAAAQADYRSARVLGTVFLMVGLVLTTIAALQ